MPGRCAGGWAVGSAWRPLQVHHPQCGVERMMREGRGCRPPQLWTQVQSLVSTCFLGVSHTMKTHWLLSSAVRGTGSFSSDRVVLSGSLSTSSPGSWPTDCSKPRAPARPQDGGRARADPGSTLPGLATSGSNTPRQCGCSAGLAAVRDMMPLRLGLCHQHGAETAEHPAHLADTPQASDLPTSTCTAS